MSSMRLVAAAVFALALAIYGVTLYPTVPGGDAGELVVVAQHRAVAHPPGYPLWTVLAWLATLVPAGSVAWRVAWVSALPAAGAAATIFWCVATFLSWRGVASPLSMAAGIGAAGVFAFSPITWLYAVGAEVFPLHTLFVAALFALLLEWERRRDTRTACAIAFTAGLGLANHLTLVFYVVPIAAWLVWSERRELSAPARLARLAASGLAGLTPYVYLWIAGLAEHPQSWGDTATWSGLVDHLLRRDYGTFQLLPAGHAGSSSLAQKLLAYARHFSTGTLCAGLLLAAAAIVLTRAKDAFVAGVAACAVFYLVVFHALANVDVGDPFLAGVLARFWLQADVALAILAGVGFGLLCTRAGSQRAAIAWTAAALAIVLRLGLGGGERLARGEGVVEDYGRAILEPLPERTLLLVHGDLVSNVVRYLQSAEGLRTDVVALDQEMLTRRWYVRRMARLHPDLKFPGDHYHPSEAGGFSMRAFLDANAGLEHVALYPEWKTGDATVHRTWTAWPAGLALRVRRADAPVDVSRWTLDSANALAQLESRGWPPIDRYEEGSWERVALEDVWQARHRRAVVLLEQAIARGNDAGLLTIARGELEAAGRMHPDPPAAYFKNLGIVYSRTEPETPWMKEKELAAWKRFLEKADASDPDRATIESAVRQMEATRPARSGADR